MRVPKHMVGVLSLFFAVDVHFTKGRFSCAVHESRLNLTSNSSATIGNRVAAYFRRLNTDECFPHLSPTTIFIYEIRIDKSKKSSVLIQRTGVDDNKFCNRITMGDCELINDYAYRCCYAMEGTITNMLANSVQVIAKFSVHHQGSGDWIVKYNSLPGPVSPKREEHAQAQTKGNSHLNAMIIVGSLAGGSIILIVMAFVLLRLNKTRKRQRRRTKDERLGLERTSTQPNLTSFFNNSGHEVVDRKVMVLEDDMHHNHIIDELHNHGQSTTDLNHIPINEQASKMKIGESKVKNNLHVQGVDDDKYAFYQHNPAQTNNPVDDAASSVSAASVTIQNTRIHIL